MSAFQLLVGTGVLVGAVAVGVLGWVTTRVGAGAEDGFRRDAAGRLVLMDTEENWRGFTLGVDRLVTLEADFRGPDRLAFNRPPGMPPEDPDWDRYWHNRLRDLRDGIGAPPEAAERYAAYVVAAREAAGLPALVS